MLRTRTKPNLKTCLLVAFLILGLPMTVFAWAFPRASRVAIYQSELSNPATLAAVSGSFTTQRPKSIEPHIVDLGYAAMGFERAPFLTRQIRPGITEIKFEQGRVVAFAPFRWKGRNGVWDPIIGVVGAGATPEQDPFHGMDEDFDLGADFEGAAGFEWNAATVRTMPATAPLIWSLDDEDFGQLYLRTLFKAMEAANEGGGWVMHTASVDAIARFGTRKKPGRVHLALWSGVGDLTHGLVIESDSAEWSRAVAHAIASTWSPMIEEAPRNQRELERLIDRGINGLIHRAD